MNLTRSRTLAALASLWAWPRSACAAALTVGNLAPQFVAPAVRQGIDETFDLRRAARQDGMLMLYFFVKAFTPA